MGRKTDASGCDWFLWLLWLLKQDQVELVGRLCNASQHQLVPRRHKVPRFKYSTYMSHKPLALAVLCSCALGVNKAFFDLNFAASGQIAPQQSPESLLVSNSLAADISLLCFFSGRPCHTNECRITYTLAL